VGERAGNAPIDLILVNLRLLGWIDRDLTRLREYCEKAAKALRVTIPRNYPVIGSDAFETGTGVHAAAVIKAYRKGDAWLADRVYSGVPAGDFGMRQRIRIGPMSGRSNVTHWLEEHGMEPDSETVDRIFDAAKRSNRLLEDHEILALARGAVRR
jgi:2-isopropylmalate synthase